MKRLCCLVLAVAMMMCGMTGYAEADTVFSAMENIPLSANGFTELSVKLNKSFDFINELLEPEEMSEMPIDLKRLAESACNVTESATGSFILSENMKQIKASAVTQLNMPLEFGDDLKAEIWMQTGVWADVDISDTENPVFRLIYKIPLSTDYYVLDYADLLEDADFDSETICEYIKKYTSDEFIKEISDFLKETVKRNATFKKGENDGEYIIYVDDKGMKSIAGDVADKFYNVLDEAFRIEGNPFSEESRYALDQAIATLGEFQILGADGLKIKVKIEDGFINVCDVSMHIDCNLYDAISAYGVDMSKFAREKWQIDCVVSLKSGLSDINTVETVGFPELNEDNTEHVWRPYDYNYNSMYESVTVISSRPVVQSKRGSYKIALPDAMSGFRISKKYYSVVGDKVVITPMAGKYNFTEAVVNVGIDSIVVDGEVYNMGDVAEKDDSGVVYIPVNALTIMTGYEVISVTHNFDENGRALDTIRFEKKNPEYVAPETVYETPSIWVKTEGAPVVYNGEIYIPLSATMGEFGIDAEDIFCLNGEITVRDSKERAPEFAEIRMSENSNKVYIDSIEVLLSNPVIEKDGKAYFPMQMLENMQCSLYAFNYNLQYGNYSFNIHRNAVIPKYPEYIPASPERILFVEDTGIPVTEDGEYYLPAWPLLGEFKVRAEDISETENTLTAIADSPLSGFKNIEFDGTSVKMDENLYNMSKPMLIKNNKKYLPTEFITDIIGGELDSVYVRYSEGKPTTYQYVMAVPNPAYEAALEK